MSRQLPCEACLEYFFPISELGEKVRELGNNGYHCLVLWHDEPSRSNVQISKQYIYSIYHNRTVSRSAFASDTATHRLTSPQPREGDDHPISPIASTISSKSCSLHCSLVCTAFPVAALSIGRTASHETILSPEWLRLWDTL